MLFSLVIPTYNSRDTIERILVSVYNNKCINDIEVIIADDWSTEPFDDILDKYREKHLNIRKIMTPKHFGNPYGGREYGRQAAQGEWIAFMDHDDEWVDGSFDQIKAVLKNNKDVHNMIVTDLLLCYEQDGLDVFNDKAGLYASADKCSLNLTHGKFYERKFIEDNDLYYDDLFSYHDVNFSTKVLCALNHKKLTYTYLSVNLYIWHIYDKSVSRSDPIQYLYDNFYDSIECSYPILRKYYLIGKEENDEQLTVDSLRGMFLDIASYYSYIELFDFNINRIKTVKKIPAKMYRALNKIFKDTKKLTGIKSNKQFIKYFAEHYSKEFFMCSGFRTTHFYIEKDSLLHFLNMLPIRSIFG